MDARGQIDAWLGPLDGGKIPGGCRDCDAYQVVTKEEHGVWRMTIHHDDWCPKWLRIQKRER